MLILDHVNTVLSQFTFLPSSRVC
ncbi:hypothetical protein V12B01_12935 [Vibrio splendidus 12B01]|nr:hypothetical protein V12B01_12935 [Vibrio splendidus 12B01]